MHLAAACTLATGIHFLSFTHPSVCLSLTGVFMFARCPRKGQSWASAKQLALFFSLLVLVAIVDNTRAATDVEFTSGQVIDSDGNAGKNVFAADLDGDGDLDVLLARLSDTKVLYYENTDGRGNFTAGTDTLFTGSERPNAVSAADLNGDGNIDVLVAFGTASSHSLT